MLPRPQRFTELYFSDYSQLPASLKTGEVHEASFTVHNLEHRATTYRYELWAEAADGKQERRVGKGVFALAHNQSRTVSRTIAVPPLGERMAVKVDLVYRGIAFGDTAASAQKQSIHYWVGLTDAEEGS